MFLRRILVSWVKLVLNSLSSRKFYHSIDFHSVAPSSTEDLGRSSRAAGPHHDSPMLHSAIPFACGQYLEARTARIGRGSPTWPHPRFLSLPQFGDGQWPFAQRPAVTAKERSKCKFTHVVHVVSYGVLNGKLQAMA